MRYCKDTHQLIADYDGFIVDLWGVVHDGQQLYDGIVSTLEAIYQAGKPLVFLSNAPRRERDSFARLDWLGIPRHYYRTIITSGETCIAYIENHLRAKAAYFLGPDIDTDWSEKAQMIRGTSMIYADDIMQADYILCIGHQYDNQPLEELAALLTSAYQRNIPLLCANPDLRIITQSGWECACAGEIAQYYEHMGGQVHYFGKPYDAVYQRAIAELALPAGSNILIVGDNPDTDIAGARAQGMDSLLLTQGVLRNILQDTRDDACMEYIATLEHQPTYVARSF